MEIRKKTILILGITLVALIGVLWLFSELTILGGFSAVEIQSAEKDTNRVLVALGTDINWLDAVAVDWASREMVREGLASHDPGASLQDLLDDETFEQLQFNYILFFDREGKLVSGRGYDLGSRRDQEIPAMLQEIVKNARVSSSFTLGTGLLGIVDAEPNPLMIALRPIIDRKDPANPSGYILMARYLDQEEISRLSGQIQLPLTTRSYSRDNLPPDFTRADSTFTNNSGALIQRQGAESLQIHAPISVQVLDENTIAGYTLINDINGEPVEVMRVSIARDIYHQGRNTTIFFMLLLIISGITFGIIIILVLDETVLSRLMRLNKRVATIGVDRDFSARVQISGNDEISGLATSVNGMLAELESSQQILHQRLIQSEENYRLFFNSITDPVIIFAFESGDLSGTIIEANAATSSVLGYPREELLQMNPTGIFFGGSEEVLNRFVADLRSGAYVQYEINYRKKDGRTIPVEINAEVFDHFGQTAVLAIARDITVRKDIERLKMEAFQQIEQNMQQFAILNDHIRNPLQAIIGIADLMEDKNSEKIVRYAKMINDLVHKLDCGYCESEKINEFLRKYYGIGKK